MMQSIELDTLITQIASHPSVSFYRDIWGTARHFEELPPVTADDFVRVPLSKRRYKDDSSIIKIVHTNAGSLLSEWTFEDIAHEEWGAKSKRPMVFMTNSYEALEKSAWCYERGMVPLIGDTDADIATLAAQRYSIDSLITDSSALQKLLPYVSERTEPLETISVIGENFDVAILEKFCVYTKRMRLVRASPVLGAFASAEFSRHPEFITLPDCVLSHEGEDLVVTKTRLLTTPIIKFRIKNDAP